MGSIAEISWKANVDLPHNLFNWLIPPSFIGRSENLAGLYPEGELSSQALEKKRKKSHSVIDMRVHLDPLMPCQPRPEVKRTQRVVKWECITNFQVRHTYIHFLNIYTLYLKKKRFYELQNINTACNIFILSML